MLLHTCKRRKNKNGKTCEGNCLINFQAIGVKLKACELGALQIKRNFNVASTGWRWVADFWAERDGEREREREYWERNSFGMHSVWYFYVQVFQLFLCVRQLPVKRVANGFQTMTMSTYFKAWTWDGRLLQRQLLLLPQLLLHQLLLLLLAWMLAPLSLASSWLVDTNLNGKFQFGSQLRLFILLC